ncbi:MAG: hypothetical protein ACOYNF_12685, partial [Rhodoferax sp.]
SFDLVLLVHTRSISKIYDYVQSYLRVQGRPNQRFPTVWATLFVALASRASRIYVQVSMYQAGRHTLEFKSVLPLMWDSRKVADPARSNVWEPKKYYEPLRSN